MSRKTIFSFENSNGNDIFKAGNDRCAYFRELEAYPILPSGENEELVKKAQDGDGMAKDYAILHNQRLVIKMALKYTGNGVDRDDLIQEGNIGLCRAIEKFDTKKGVKFTTYALFWIRQAMTRAISNQSNTIRLPVHVSEKKKRLKKKQVEMTQELSREVNFQTVVDQDSCRYFKAGEAIAISMDEFFIGSEFEECINQKIARAISTIDPHFEEVAEIAEAKKKVGEAFKRLKPRERLIIELRFGFRDGKSQTLAQISPVVGCTRERVRQIQVKAMLKLSNYLAEFSPESLKLSTKSGTGRACKLQKIS